MLIDNYQLQQTQKRFDERTAQRKRNERLIEEHRPLEVDTPERVQQFLKRRGLALSADGTPTVEALSTVMAGETAGLPPEIALERQIGASDLMGVAFLAEGLRVANTIARIWISVRDSRPAGYATGFMVSPRLLITNHHVLGDPIVARNSLAEFNYERRADGTITQGVNFTFDPDKFFYADRDLDYACVAVGARSRDGRDLSTYGYNLLSEDEGKAIAAQWANIIQHPSGEPKQLSLRENQIVDVLPQFLHYKTDTAPGSSGAPVFNDRWEIVALHHSGVYAKTADGRPMAVDGQPWQSWMGEDRIKWEANEGVRISRLIQHLRDQLRTDAHRTLFNEMLAPSQDVVPLVIGSPREAATQAPPQAAMTATVAEDGSATWTIPLTVTVNVGGKPAAPSIAAAPPAAAPSPLPAAPPEAPTPPTPATTGKSPNEVLAAARAELGQRGNVMSVRLGYVFDKGRITSERALVVTVRKKMSNADLRVAGVEELPASYGGLKVQVSDPTIEELILADQGVPAREALALNLPSVEEITYTPPPSPGLQRVKASMTVNAHLSPDAGWTQLSAFLDGTKKTLTVGMYDFGAPHIVDALKNAGTVRGFKEMLLTIQPGQSVGSGTKANDLKDKEVVDELEAALGDKFKVAWVKIGAVNGWVASSYHIKVAVRDKSSFWLSSGNWQSSNQPPANPLALPWKRSWLSEYNREWHAIVDHPGLAADFEKYLRNDYDHNIGGAEEAMILPDLLMPAEMFTPTATERAAAFKYFEPLIETREFDVQPLLTPDNYHEHVLSLIESAQEELLIQNQTFNAPKPNHAKLRELMSAVLDKQRAGVNVRVIFRLLMKADARKNLEALQDFGFDMSAIRVQRNCHTKGIVVDRQRVMIGSQNWSEQGVSLNRDASLLFEDEKLANYFANVFEHDWANLATDDIDSAPSGVELATAEGAAPRGMVKVSIEEYLETL